MDLMSDFNSSNLLIYNKIVKIYNIKYFNKGAF